MELCSEVKRRGGVLVVAVSAKAYDYGRAELVMRAKKLLDPTTRFWR